MDGDGGESLLLGEVVANLEDDALGVGCGLSHAGRIAIESQRLACKGGCERAVGEEEAAIDVFAEAVVARRQQQHRGQQSPKAVFFHIGVSF